MKVAILTDTHYGFSKRGDQANVLILKKIAEAKPSIVIHCGDYGSSNHVDRYNFWALARRLLGPEVIIGGVNGNHDCLDIHTELLTKRGWVLYSDIKKDDLVYSYDIQKDKGQWDKINNIIIKETDNVISTQIKQYSFVGTEGHRVLCSVRNNKNDFKEYDYIAAKNLKGRIKIKSSASEKKVDYDIPDGIVQLTGWILTDGYIHREKDAHTGQYIIYQSKPIDSIVDILESLQYTYTIHERNRYIKEICGKKLVKKCLPQKEISLSNESAKDFSKYVYTKEFPSWLYSLSDRQFELFLQSVLKANASESTHGGSYVLYGTEEFLEKFQILCVLHNRRTLYKIDTRGDPRLYITDRDSVQFDAMYHNITIEQKQTVWCLGVPLTNFMVRREGTTYFTGNCWNPSGQFIGIDPENIEEYNLPLNPKDIIINNLKIMDRHKIIHLNDGSIEIQDNNKTITITGFDGWYRDDVSTNDQHYIPGYRPTGIQWLQNKAHKDFGECIKTLNEAKLEGHTTILVSHFGFLNSEIRNDYKAKSSPFDCNTHKEYFGANTKYEEFLDSVDYVFFGHSHTPFDGYAANGKTRCINVGSDYEMPKYKIIEI
jgi:predicted phosphodiesterase